MLYKSASTLIIRYVDEILLYTVSNKAAVSLTPPEGCSIIFRIPFSNNGS